MKYRTLSKWDNPTACHGLILFAQLVEELLFEYSLDTYKSSVMQTGTLCYEALLTLKEIEAGNIKSPNRNHVLAELCASYDKDEVAKSLISLPAASFMGILKNPKSSNGEVKTVVELLLQDVAYARYKKRNEDLLISEIEGAQSAANIRKLTRSYLTTLTWGGWSHKHIQEVARKFFHYGPDRIGDSKAIRDFLSIFNDEQKKYIAIFRVKKTFADIANSCSKIGVSIENPLSGELNAFEARLPLAETGEVYAVIRELQGKDEFAARRIAESKLRLAQTLLSLFHQKDPLTWVDECIVAEVDSKSTKILKKHINPMLKCVDRPVRPAGVRLEKLVEEFSLEDDSFAKFIRSALLHTMAIKSDSGENQLLNLWIAIESLVPSETKADDASNIEHIVSSLVPFLNVTYLRRLVNNLVKDLLRWDRHTTLEAFKDVEGAKFHEKLVRILVLPEYQSKLDLLEKNTKLFVLLQDRIDHFKLMFSSPSNICTVLETHTLRLEWQIRRIYRTRNIIVHSGVPPRFTEQLIEHSHDYLDIVLESLVRLASNPSRIKSVAQGFKYVELRYKSYIQKISDSELVFDKQNISDLVFPRA